MTAENTFTKQTNKQTHFCDNTYISVFAFFLFFGFKIIIIKKTFQTSDQ